MNCSRWIWVLAQRVDLAYLITLPGLIRANFLFFRKQKDYRQEIELTQFEEEYNLNLKPYIHLQIAFHRNFCDGGEKIFLSKPKVYY